MTSAPTTSVISARSSSPSPPRFSSFHGKDWELRDVVAGYGCIDLFVEVASYCSWSELILADMADLRVQESKGAFSYTGPKLNRERGNNSTFFTWEYQVPQCSL